MVEFLEKQCGLRVPMGDIPALEIARVRSAEMLRLLEEAPVSDETLLNFDPRWE
jgi:hypothetical protein